MWLASSNQHIYCCITLIDSSTNTLLWEVFSLQNDKPNSFLCLGCHFVCNQHWTPFNSKFVSSQALCQHHQQHIQPVVFGTPPFWEEVIGNRRCSANDLRYCSLRDMNAVSWLAYPSPPNGPRSASFIAMCNNELTMNLCPRKFWANDWLRSYMILLQKLALEIYAGQYDFCF